MTDETTPHPETTTEATAETTTQDETPLVKRETDDEVVVDPSDPGPLEEDHMETNDPTAVATAAAAAAAHQHDDGDHKDSSALMINEAAIAEAAAAAVAAVGDIQDAVEA
jgi:hypothetical protein